MSGYPKSRPDKIFSYFIEVMNGFQHNATDGMLQEEQIENGLKCMRNIQGLL
jgi:non-lysosomal glucosylceramidase